MKIRVRDLAVAVILLGLVFASPVFSGKGFLTLKGLIESQDEDDDGNAVSINLAVTVESEDDDAEALDYYSVKLDKIGKQLLSHVSKQVTVTGTVKTDNDGNKTITVVKFELPKPEIQEEVTEEENLE